MSSYTPADIRKKVDDFDDIIRAAVIERNIESVFGKKRRNFDELMKIRFTTFENAELQQEFSVPRYVWEFAEGFIPAKKEGKLVTFWGETATKLKEFDEKNPTSRGKSQLEHAIDQSLSMAPPPPRPSPPPADLPPPLRSQPLPRTLPLPRKLPQPSKPLDLPKNPPPASTRSPLPPIPLPQPRPKAMVGDSSKPRPASPTPASSSSKTRLTTLSPAAGPSQLRRTNSPPAAGSSKLRPAVNRPKSPPPVAGPSQPRIRQRSASSTPSSYVEGFRIPWRLQPKPKPKPKPTSPPPQPLDESELSNHSEYLPAIKVKHEKKADKGKSKMTDLVPKGDESGPKKRKPPQSTGEIRDPPCGRCTMMKVECFTQMGGLACLMCAKRKLRCDDAKPKEEKKKSEPKPKKSKPSAKAPKAKAIVKPSPPKKAPAPSAPTRTTRTRIQKAKVYDLVSSSSSAGSEDDHEPRQGSQKDKQKRAERSSSIEPLFGSLERFKVGKNREQRFDEMEAEVERIRGIVDVMLPAFLRLREDFDELKADNKILRRAYRENTRLYNILQERYFDLIDKVPAEDDRMSPQNDMPWIPEFEAPRARTPTEEMMRTDEPMVASPRVEAPLFEVPPSAEMQRVEETRAEMPMVEAPGGEMPMVETPMAETPRVEAPSTEVSNTEVPRIEVPLTEVPSTEVPRTEVPRTEVENSSEVLPRANETSMEDEEAKTFDVQMDEVVPRAELSNVEVPKNDDLPLHVSESTADDSDMPPPPTPTVTLQPPTPLTSQEAANSAPSTLLQVPVNTTVMDDESGPNTIRPEPSGSGSSASRSRSTSLEPRRSPRLRSRSPTPIPSILPQKRSADGSAATPAAKKSRNK